MSSSSACVSGRILKCDPSGLSSSLVLLGLANRCEHSILLGPCSPVDLEMHVRICDVPCFWSVRRYLLAATSNGLRPVFKELTELNRLRHGDFKFLAQIQHTCRPTLGYQLCPTKGTKTLPPETFPDVKISPKCVTAAGGVC